MLRASQRLTGRHIDEIIQKGRVAHSPFFVVRYCKDERGASSDGARAVSTEPARFAAVAPVKVAQTSAARHLVRRRTYEAARPLVGRMTPGILVVAFAKTAVLGAKPLAIRADLEAVFVKMGIVR